MKYKREDIIRQMSEIFRGIPDVIIGDIFDSIVSEDIKLYNKTDAKNSNIDDNSSSNKYVDDMINVHNKLFDKLSEITESGNNVDIDIYNDKNDVFESFSEDSVLYLDVCMKNCDLINNRLILNNRVETGLINKLKKRPWDLSYIEKNIINSEFKLIKGYLDKIFNSSKLYKIKESENKFWPPEGPGFESKFIALKVTNNYFNDEYKRNELIIKLRDEIKYLTDIINQSNIEYNKSINNTNIKEYRLIKCRELKVKLDKLKLEKKIAENKYLNEIFNSQNSNFIEFILQSKSENITLINLHNCNRNEALNITIICIVMILKFKLNVDFDNTFFKNNYNNVKKLISNDELYLSQKNFKGNYVDLHICVGLGNNNYTINNVKPKLASLIRRLSYALNLTWRFGINGVIILRVQDNVDWYKYINQTLKIS
ncbi:hypothetical protein FG386_002596 [Cryptosporidium ryanae]|uniref:uncharacterized protein n=1 Tax=Cryptosporidium ryanae TaxID=515981 RepID=UPI003519F9BE|nr:hypothetical protein FG386_002596 [Cryptosporidium ryanae]